MTARYLPQAARRLVWLLVACHVSLVTCHAVASAAVAKGSDKQLETGGTNQSGGTVTSSNFRQQINVGEAVAGGRLTSSRFRILPGFIGATLSTAPLPVTDLDLTVLAAKTEPFGTSIAAQAWQKDRDPYFAWDPPSGGAALAGYSYVLDGTLDDTVDTTGTSWDVATSSLKQLADGKHTFSVKALNTAGNSGQSVSLEVWVDTTPPQIASYSPSPGGLIGVSGTSVTATVSDAGSGVNQTTVSVLLNGQSLSTSFDAATGALTTTGSGAWKEGTNSLELRVSDVVGNAQTPLVWSLTRDTTPPSGSVLINGGAEMTTSAYVTLSLTASDSVAGLERMLISNDEVSGYVEEPFVALRELWQLNLVRGLQTVYVKFSDQAGNVSAPVSDAIDLGLLAPETVLTSGPAGFTPQRSATFTFMCPGGDCVFSYAFDAQEWSDWSPQASAEQPELMFGNHYFRVKAAKEVNGLEGIQPDEEDPSPAERTWIVGVQPPAFTVPKGPPIKVWRLE